MRIILFANVFIFLPFWSTGQATERSCRCKNDIFTFELPSDFIDTHSHYTEGDYYHFYRIDSVSKMDTTRLTIHCGSNVKLPHLTGSDYSLKSGSTFMRAGTQTNGRKWKEYNLPGDINIFYQNASFHERRLFDSIINDLLIQIKESPTRLSNPSKYILDHFKLTGGWMFSKENDSITSSSLISTDQFNLSLSNELIDFEVSKHVLKNPYYKDDLGWDDRFANYPLSYSVIYEGRIVSLFDPGVFVCHDIESLERDLKFETQLNDRKFKYHWILNGELAARGGNSIYIFDQGEWIKSKLKYPPNDQPKLYEDEHFIAFNDCIGEWGGTVYFFDKHSNKIFFTEATCANSIYKTDNKYYVLSHLGHMTGFSELNSIPDPSKLSIAEKNQIGKMKEGGALGYNDDSGASSQVMEFYDIQLFSTFTYNDQQLYIGHLNDLTFLARIDGNQIEIVHPLFANNLYTHEPVTQKYDELILINLDFYGTAIEREVSMILIHDNRLIKIDWNKNQSR